MTNRIERETAIACSIWCDGKSFEGRDNIVFLMMNVDNKIKESTTFIQENDYDLPAYVPASPIPSDYLAGAILGIVVLDKNGEIAARLEGSRDYAHPEIVQAWNELMDE